MPRRARKRRVMSLRFDAPSAIGTLESIREAGSDRFRFRCPECGSTAFSAGSDLLCPAEGKRFAGCEGVLPLMRAERTEALAPFLDAYRAVRRIEGWGGAADYYRGLPFESEGRHRAVWKIRARSYRGALRAIARRFPEVKRADEWDKLALRVLEVGAGNGWFSWRMAQAGHYVLATDVSPDEEDGLGAIARYSGPRVALEDRLTCALAEMEDLPLEDAQFDLVVANGSLHYAGRIQSAVSEAHRVLRPGGLFLVLDSPVYDQSGSGLEMVRRRREHHRDLGIADSAATAGFLVERDFLALSAGVGFLVDVQYPFEGFPRRLRRIYCRLRCLAPPARFPLFALEKASCIR
jgi:SAM-dependent methyltransferase